MNLIKWTVAGLIGGAIGAGIWVAVGYFTGYEVGWIAWGVGFLAGLGVRMAAGDEVGWSPGLAAVATAIASVSWAKYAVVSLAISDMMGGVSTAPVTANVMVAGMAEEIAAEYEEEGRKVEWPEIPETGDMPLEKQYPREIWTEARGRWDDLSPAEQEEKKQDRRERTAAMMSEFESAMRESAFSQSFTPWDLLWFGLAAFTAFKVGAAAVDEE